MGGRTGRHPKPLAILELAGEDTRTKSKKRADNIYPRAPYAPPEDIVSDSEALRFWEHVVKHVPAAVLSTVDEMDIHAAAKAWSNYRKLEKAADAVQVGQEGFAETYRLYFQALKSYTNLSAKFGMNPADRGRIKLETKPSNDDPLQSLLKKRKSS